MDRHEAFEISILELKNRNILADVLNQYIHTMRFGIDETSLNVFILDL